MITDCLAPRRLVLCFGQACFCARWRLASSLRPRWLSANSGVARWQRALVMRALVMLALAAVWTPAPAHAICGLELALRELRLELSRQAAANELSAPQTAVGLRGFSPSATCSVCHLAGFGGPRNEFGTAANALLTLRDRRDPVRNRDAGRRLLEIVANPALPDSPTFGQLFQQGWVPAGPLTGTGSNDVPLNPAPPAIRLSVSAAEQRVRQAQTEGRFGILQLSRVQDLDPRAATVLATFRGETLILGITSLSPEVAMALAGSAAETLWLPAVTSLSPESAAAIRQMRGRLVLTGLTKLDSVELAEKLVADAEAVSFPYLRELSPKVAQALAKSERSLTLASLTRPSLEVQETLAQTVGSLALPGLQSLDSLALANKLANTVVLLPQVESLTEAQVEALVGIRGQDSFFGGVFLPLAVVTPEIARVLAATPRAINLILLGDQFTSNEVLPTLLGSKLGVSLPDVAALSPEQVEWVAAALVQAEAQPGVVKFPRLTLPKLRRLDSAVLTETLGRLNQYNFPGVVELSPAAAAVLGNFPNDQRRLSDGRVEILLSNVSFPDLPELWPEAAQPLLKRRWSAINLPSVEDLSLETLEQIAEQTSSLNLGIATLPEEFADAVGAVPFDSERGSGSLKLPRVRELSPAAARRLVDALNRGVQGLRRKFGDNLALPKLELGDDFLAPLNGWTKLPPDVARELARFDGSLSLNGLGELPDESAVALAAFKGPYLTLSGPGVEQLSPAAAAALAQVPGVLRVSLRHLDSVVLAERFARQLSWTLYDLESVSPAAGDALANYRPFFNLDALTSLETVAMAARFADGTTGGGQINLPALRQLSPQAAERLAQGSKKVSLGLTVLEQPDIARSLARCSGGVALTRLRAVTPEVREILRESPSITTPPLDSLYLLVEPVPSSD